MYSINKIKPRIKDVNGPQLTLQATATVVSERPINMKQVSNTNKLEDKIYKKDLLISGGGAGIIPNTPTKLSQQLTENHYVNTFPVGRVFTAPKQCLTTAYNDDLMSTLSLNMKMDDNIDKKNMKFHSSAPRISTSLSGDKVIFSESSLHPGFPLVFRSNEERQLNPDRLNLDRRRLTVCPMLENEDQLRLLNYQHNLITKIQNVSRLKKLIFLDMYDNQIEFISGIELLKSLRVLMLGNNRIKKIENLTELTKLDVLDLHGNQIEQIENLNHLSELRVLNLAGNLLSKVDNLNGMEALQELNLRRNKITVLNDIENLPNLQRLFLSLNELFSFNDLACLSDCTNLIELTLDGNPISLEQNYKQNVLKFINHLKTLDNRKIAEDDRRLAMMMIRKNFERKRENCKGIVIKERRKIPIGNTKRQWELTQSALISKTSGHVNSIKEIHATHLANIPNEEIINEVELNKLQYHTNSNISRPSSAKACVEKNTNNFSKPLTRPLSSTGSSIKRQSLDKLNHLAELENDTTLSLYGNGALDSLDKNWGISAAGSITTIIFKFIDFDFIVKILGKLRSRYPAVNTLIFTAANIKSLAQFNALAVLRRLEFISIEPDGNPVTRFVLWKSYLLFRLAHLGLKKINDYEISPTDIVNAEKYFSMLSHMTTTQLSNARLSSLINDSRRKYLSNTPDQKIRIETCRQIDKQHPGESISRSALTYKSQDIIKNQTKSSSIKKRQIKCIVTELISQAHDINQKQFSFQQIWPNILADLIRKIIIDLSFDLSSYSKKQLLDILDN